MSNNLDSLRSLLKKSLSVLTNPATSADPDFNTINMRISECLKIYGNEDLEAHLLGPERKGYRPAKDINDFAMLVEAVLLEEQEIEGRLERDKYIFRKYCSDNEINNPTISWKILKRKPGLMQQVKIHDENGKREYVYRFRGVSDDVTDVGYSIFHYGKIMDNYVEFTMNANDPATVDEMATWFEDVMDRYKWFFSFQGINRVFFIERTEDSFENIRSNLQYKISMIYFIRTEKTISLKTKDLERITINLCVTK